MLEPIISTFVTTALTGLAADFFTNIAKGVKGLFDENESKTFFNTAFQEFKEKCFADNKTKDEKKLLHVFQEFFSDSRTIRQFKPALEGQSRDVDFNLMQEIFVDMCIEQGIEISTFDFFRALSMVTTNIETAAQKKGRLQKTFTLSKRDEETNVTYARFKYLYQLSRHNNRLQFTGIPHPQEKNEIHLPSVFVMQRA